MAEKWTSSAKTWPLKVASRYGAPLQMTHLKHGIFDDSAISVICSGRERAFPVDGNVVLAAFQDRGGDEELKVGKPLRGEVLDESAGCHTGLRIGGKDAWVFPPRIEQVTLQAGAVQLHGDFVALDMLKQNQSQPRFGAGFHGLPDWKQKRGCALIVPQVKEQRSAVIG